MTSHYTWGSVSTLHDFEGALGCPLDTSFWAFRISWSRLLDHVWSGPKWDNQCRCTLMNARNEIAEMWMMMMMLAFIDFFFFWWGWPFKESGHSGPPLKPPYVPRLARPMGTLCSRAFYLGFCWLWLWLRCVQVLGMHVCGLYVAPFLSARASLYSAVMNVLRHNFRRGLWCPRWCPARKLGSAPSKRIFHSEH